jgi:(2Fe-2S) ferredoxin
MPRFKKHIFICENLRGSGHPRGSCAEKSSKELRELFKKKIAILNLQIEVRVNSCGCLDACEFGPTVLIYPEQIWYGGVKSEDIDEIVEQHLERGKPVDRLIIKDSKYL